MKTAIRVFVLSTALMAGIAQAGLFDDEEARRAILDLRQRVDSSRQESDKRVAEEAQRASEESAQLRRALLELQNQIELLRTELARMQGRNEQLTHDVSELQRQQKDVIQGVNNRVQIVDERLSKFEPVKVMVDGREITVEQSEKRDYDSALAVFRKGDFAGAQKAFVDFLRRYNASSYSPSAYFWLGNSQYATRDYKEAIQNFRTLLGQSPDHLRAPEAVLSIANCQIELKDSKAARKTLEELMKAYPQSEAASAAKERLARLK